MMMIQCLVFASVDELAKFTYCSLFTYAKRSGHLRKSSLVHSADLCRGGIRVRVRVVIDRYAM